MGKERRYRKEIKRNNMRLQQRKCRDLCSMRLCFLWTSAADRFAPQGHRPSAVLLSARLLAFFLLFSFPFPVCLFVYLFVWWVCWGEGENLSNYVAPDSSTSILSTIFHMDISTVPFESVHSYRSIRVSPLESVHKEICILLRYTLF